MEPGRFAVMALNLIRAALRVAARRGRADRRSGDGSRSCRRPPTVRDNGGAALAGLLAILAGAWLVVGPSEWPVLKSTQQYVFAPATPMRSFTYVVGAAETWDRAFFSQFLERSPSPGRHGSRRSTSGLSRL